MPTAQPMTPCTDSGSHWLISSKMPEVTLKRRRVELEVHRKEGNKKQVASGRWSRRQIGWKEQAFPTCTHTGSKVQLCPFPAVWPQASYMVFMSFRKILIYKVGKINPATSEHLCRVKGVLSKPPIQASPYIAGPPSFFDWYRISFLVCKGTAITIGCHEDWRKMYGNGSVNCSPIKILVINIPWDYGVKAVTAELINRSHVWKKCIDHRQRYTAS